VAVTSQYGLQPGGMTLSSIGGLLSLANYFALKNSPGSLRGFGGYRGFC
jgi:hypothetical protein